MDFPCPCGLCSAILQGRSTSSSARCSLITSSSRLPVFAEGVRPQAADEANVRAARRVGDGRAGDGEEELGHVAGDAAVEGVVVNPARAGVTAQPPSRPTAAGDAGAGLTCPRRRARAARNGGSGRGWPPRWWSRCGTRCAPAPRGSVGCWQVSSRERLG
jgi:hypothetical protein